MEADIWIKDYVHVCMADIRPYRPIEDKRADLVSKRTF